MHFYYIDESGDTGANLADPNQPVVVLRGISVRDDGWNHTHQELERKLHAFFGGPMPANFELHATDLLSPQGGGSFRGYSIKDHCQLCLLVLDILSDRSHGVHYIALDKQSVSKNTLGIEVQFNPRRTYLLAFDCLVTFINWHIKEKLGRSARGMIIQDRKDQFHQDIEKIMRERRFGGTAAHRVKWVVEFSYPIDSKKNPMIQLCDLVIYCVKRFVEVEHGYRTTWSDDVKNFYATCYFKIRDRLPKGSLVARGGRGMERLNQYLNVTRIEPRTQWRRHYEIG
jgi:hypothetical protein